MSHPLLLEINTRCWLRELSDQSNQSVSLSSVPNQEFLRWRRLRFTHIWLMGVWSTGPQSQSVAAADSRLQQACATFADPGEIIVGSPYAIANYNVPESLGGKAGLMHFRQKLHQHGLKLILDFVPNHVGLDHPWLTTRPNLFVASSIQQYGTFSRDTVLGHRWIAHGKDPFFPPWNDTAQLDYRRPETRAAMTEVLQSVAARCDGVRCDMAMLLLNDVFADNWKHFPASTPPSEFWPESIAAVKKAHPHFLTIAEVYWDLETRLQGLGFDYTYDKTFYDHIVRRDESALREHIRKHSANPRMLRFLENHDEPPIASLLTAEEHKAALQLLLSQPCMRLIHHNQLQGKRLHTPVQFARHRPEMPAPETRELYEHMLEARS